MKIDQEILSSLSTNTHELNSEIMVVKYFETEILVDKKGAKQLIEILKEFVNEDS